MTQPMHVIILAAGCSRRMGALTADQPKSFLPVAGKRLIDFTFDALEARGFSRVTLVIGYQAALVRRTLQSGRGRLRFDYAVSEDYETTGHGWSLFLARDAWQESRQPVLLLHSDIFYHPEILDRVLGWPRADVLAVDERYQVKTGDEVVILGQDGRATGSAKGLAQHTAGIAGELIGVNKWSPSFLEAYFAFMEDYFRRNGRNHNYEPILDEFLRQEPGCVMEYATTDGLPWINMNYAEDYALVRDSLHPAVYGS